MIGEAQSVSHPNFCIVTDYKKVYVDNKCRGDLTLVYDNHLLGFSVTGEVHTSVQSLQCWDTGQGGGNGTGIIMYGCHSVAHPDLKTTYPSQNFVYDKNNNQIKHIQSNRCAQIFPEASEILLVHCSEAKDQKWLIKSPRWNKS